MATDAAYGLRSIQVSSAAAAACGFCGYFAAKALTAMFVENAEKRATIWTVIGFGGIAVSAVYAAFMIYRGSPRTKMLAALALAISLAGGYAAWTVGWKKGGNPSTFNVL